ncbi:MAG: hypothetical protein QHH15_07890, partial [Candidatus Thermoplasmatota archaeon]|nr:hypothetical protein [Candidatus Thermoplasmatota archaeon]
PLGNGMPCNLLHGRGYNNYKLKKSKLKYLIDIVIYYDNVSIFNIVYNGFFASNNLFHMDKKYREI